MRKIFSLDNMKIHFIVTIFSVNFLAKQQRKEGELISQSSAIIRV